MSASAEDASNGDKAAAFLSCRDIHASYGESCILQGMSFDVREGGVMALLGRNEAGKTSTLRTIARAHEPALRQGEIWLDGQPLHEANANEAARAGVQLVPEDRRIIPGLTVEENLIVAQVAPGLGWSLDEIYAYFPRLAERRRQDAVTLPDGEQQMLAVARAIAREVKLLLLDEPFEGLEPQIVQEVEAVVEQVKKLGITTIIVEQNVLAALQLADTAVIVAMGEVAYQGTAQEVLDNKELREEYVAV